MLKKNVGDAAEKKSRIISTMLPFVAVSLAACGSETETTSSASSGEGGGQVPSGSNASIVKATYIVDSTVPTALAETSVDTLNLVFKASASLDVSNLSQTAVINLGLDENDIPSASTGRADLDEITSSDVTLNIYSDQMNIELDYARDASDTMTINFMNSDGDISVGSAASNTNTAIELVNGPKSIHINHTTGDQVTFQGGIRLHDDPGNTVTEELFITTSREGGDLSIGKSARETVFENTSTLQHVSIYASDGDMVLMDDVTNQFMNEIDSLQTYKVTADDADVEIGRLGACNTKDDMETIHIGTVANGTLRQHAIDAELSDIALVHVFSSDKNTLTSGSATSPALPGTFNVVLEQLSADHVRILNIESGDGGHILLANQSYVVDDVIVSGSGDVTIHAGINCSIPGAGFVQNKPVDTTNHTGDFTFIDGGGSDTIHGSDGDDEITFGGGGGGDTYNDGPGDDEVFLKGPGPFDVDINDSCEDASDDTITFDSTTAFPPSLDMTFNAGGGNDYISLPQLSGSSNNLLIDFSDWCSGMVCIDVFTPNSFFLGTSLFNFVGMSGITSRIDGGTITNTPLPNGVTDSSFYFVDNSDVAIGGVTIGNHKSIDQAARYLSEAVNHSTSNGDAAIFLVKNGTQTANDGDDWVYYFYHYEESDGQSGISTDEVQLFACVNTATNFLSQPINLTSADIA